MNTQKIVATRNKTETKVINVCAAGEKKVAYFLTTNHLLKPPKNLTVLNVLTFTLLYCVRVQTTKNSGRPITPHPCSSEACWLGPRAKSTITLFSSEKHTAVDKLAQAQGSASPWS